jgi:hypothetical protein
MQGNRLRPRDAHAASLDPMFSSAWSLPPAAAVKTMPLSPEELQKLRALGYLNKGR